jgi:7,8-dihydropterin-6-yl-methyl-4-(beta-D-ribofuranosyl)aminobenzene 5'-phosphate synthase
MHPYKIRKNHSNYEPWFIKNIINSDVLYMKISILTENCAGSYTLAEHGLSYLIEFDGRTILFDSGQSDMFLKNAQTLQIKMDHIDMVILSHGHFDHGDGLGFLSGFNLLCHPGCFQKRYREKDHSFIGLNKSREEISLNLNVITSSGPYQITERIWFLGEIPRLTDFESQSTPFVFEDGTPDYVPDDSALAMVLPEGLFVVTGCGHAGIVNTLEHARRITGCGKIYGVIGGFHLKVVNSQLEETIRYLQAKKVQHIFPSHCTELPALSVFYDHFRIKPVKTGDILNF